MLIEIKSWVNGNVIQSIEADNLKSAIELLVKKEADLRGANLWGADLWEANLLGADLQGANLWEADLREADLREADLQGSNLRGANLREANLREADLRGADLRGADLWEANLREANLRGANLRGADLQGADLWGANLLGADLREADLREADLQGANLWGADLREAKYKEPLFLCDLYSLKLLPEETTLIFWKYLQYGKSPYKNCEYKVGEEYTFDDCDKSEYNLCGKGGNVATLMWCLKDNLRADEFIEVEFQVKDIVAIPVNSDGKFRVKRFKVLRKINRKQSVKLLNGLIQK